MARKAAVAVKDNEHSEPKLKAVNNHLKLRIDDLQTFAPLTANQKLFFDAYKRGDYFFVFKYWSIFWGLDGLPSFKCFATSKHGFRRGYDFMAY